MSLVYDASGRLHIDTPLMAESLMDKSLLAAGIGAVETESGQPVTHGLIQTNGLRPARRHGHPVAVVQPAGDVWLPLKLD